MKSNSRMKSSIWGLLIVSLSIILLYAFPGAMGGLGGAILFTILVIGLLEILLSTSIIFKKGHQISEHIILSILLFFLFVGCINFIAFLEKGTAPENYDRYHKLFIAANITSFIFLYIYMIRLVHFFKNKDEVPSEIMSDHFKAHLAVSFSLFFIAETFILLGTTMYLVMLEHMPYDPLLRTEWLTMSNIILSVLIISFLISLIYTAKLDIHSVSRFIANRHIGINKAQLMALKKYFFPVIALIAVLGTGMEISRGLMHTWFLTLLLIIVVAIHLWKVLMLVIEAKDA